VDALGAILAARELLDVLLVEVDLVGRLRARLGERGYDQDEREEAREQAAHDESLRGAGGAEGLLYHALKPGGESSNPRGSLRSPRGLGEIHYHSLLLRLLEHFRPPALELLERPRRHVGLLRLLAAAARPFA